jgi:magnesium-transporting ATPase (P-type)
VRRPGGRRTTQVGISEQRPAAEATPDEAWQRLIGLAPEEVYAEVGTRRDGLTEAEARSRLDEHGTNRIEEVRGPSLMRRLLAQFVHLFALLLWAGSALAFVAGLPTFGIAIIGVIVLNGIFGFFQEYRAERAVAALRRLLPPQATVVRGGDETRISAEALVPGDVMVLQEGDRASADARLVEAADLRVDESNLSGEAHPVRKTAQPEREVHRNPIHAHNMVFAGSTVIAGGGSAVVIATGMRTEFGRIAALAQLVRPEPSPLQKEVGRVAQRVAFLSVAMGGTFFAIGFALAGLSFRDGAIFAIGIVLGNVPEGLLPTMTLALAMGVQRMARRNAVVKRLSSVETLGSCTVICTDKTGTLTTNQMTVRELWSSRRRAQMTGAGYQPEGELVSHGRPLSRADLVSFLPVLRIGHLCNTARLVPSNGERRSWQLIGDPTEGALLIAARKANLDQEFDLRLRPVIRRLAFDPKRKRMSTVHRALPREELLVMYVKGAPLELLDHCTRILVDGVELPLTDELRAEAVAENDRMASKALRVLGTAYRYLPADVESRLAELRPAEAERDLVFAGLVGMQDPPREEVPTAIESARLAGIRVMMITGDYGLTAESIARQVGLLREQPVHIVDGAELDVMSEEALRHVVSGREVIFARTTPEHKLRIVSALRSLGEIVAVTGDGVNDAPALKHADIGVAMGIAGTDVAREAADMILVDDNFATIVAAVEDGRAIFDNMRKFIVYIFAHLSPEAIPFIFFALFHIPLPLTVMQILAIDLGTETLPALALGVERPELDVMRRPPRPRTERLLDVRSLLRGYVFLGFMTTAVVLGAFLLFLISRGWHWGEAQAPTVREGAEATTILFLGIVLMQVANAFACRTERVTAFMGGLFTNRFLLWGIAFELAFTAILIYVPLFQPIFGTAQVGPQWWGLLAAFAPLVFLAEEGRKATARRWGHSA